MGLTTNLMEENTGIAAEELLKRKSIFRVLYVQLFCKQSNFLTTFAALAKRNFVKVDSYTVDSILRRRSISRESESVFNQNSPTKNLYSVLLEQRAGTPRQFKNLDSVFAHPFLPVLCLIEECELCFVYTRTMTVCNTLSLAKARKVKSFQFDPQSFKFLVVDGSQVAWLYKYTIDFGRIELVQSFESIKADTGVFIDSPACVLLLNASQEVHSYDLIWNKIKTVEYTGASLQKTKVEYVKEAKQLLFVNKQKGSVWTQLATDLSKKGTLQLSTEEVSCFYVHGKLLLLGLQSGLLRYYAIDRGNMILEQSFGEKEGKRIRVEDLTVCSGFVVAGLSNGSVSIVMKV